MDSSGVVTALRSGDDSHPATCGALGQRNVAIAERLTASGRMHRSGEDEIRRAKADDRWSTAYAGQAVAEVPEDRAHALAENLRAEAMFLKLTSANRYAILYRVGSAKSLRPEPHVSRSS
jgi:uncharacterized protein YdeI (YjbR/CyaY-like superfamily)